MTTLSSRDVNQDIGRAKKAAADGPVIITDRGRPSHVLLNIEDYRQLTDAAESVAEALSSTDDIELEAFLPARSLGARHVGLA